MTRITYKEANELLTSKDLQAAQDLYKVVINTNTLEAEVTNIHTGLQKMVLKGTKDLIELKKLVRKEVEKLGVVFKDEVRSGRKLKETLKVS